MSTPIEVKLFQAASANPGLLAVLGTSPFRWYSTQLTPGSQFPAIVAHQVSGQNLNAFQGRLQSSRLRVQFTIFEGPVPDTSNTVWDALMAFMDSFSATATGIPNNQIANITDGMYVETQPPIFQTMVDFFIWNQDNT